MDVNEFLLRNKSWRIQIAAGLLPVPVEAHKLPIRFTCLAFVRDVLAITVKASPDFDDAISLLRHICPNVMTIAEQVYKERQEEKCDSNILFASALPKYISTKTSVAILIKPRLGHRERRDVQVLSVKGKTVTTKRFYDTIDDATITFRCSHRRWDHVFEYGAHLGETNRRITIIPPSKTTFKKYAKTLIKKIVLPHLLAPISKIVLDYV